MKNGYNPNNFILLTRASKASERKILKIFMRKPVLRTGKIGIKCRFINRELWKNFLTLFLSKIELYSEKL